MSQRSRSCGIWRIRSGERHLHSHCIRTRESLSCSSCCRRASLRRAHSSQRDCLWVVTMHFDINGVWHSKPWSSPASVCGGPYCTPPLLSSIVSQHPVRIVVGHPSVDGVGHMCASSSSALNRERSCERSSFSFFIRCHSSPSRSRYTSSHTAAHTCHTHSSFLYASTKSFRIFYRPQYQMKHRIG